MSAPMGYEVRGQFRTLNNEELHIGNLVLLK
jgi:hypothetical protein